MLIGLLMALIFGGGAESEFTSSIPHIKKEIHQNVDDKSREDAILSSKKEWRQDQKQVEKSEDRLNKVFTDLNEIVVRHIEDTAKVGIVTQSLYDFESSIYAAVDEAYELEVERKLRLDDKDATREEIVEMYEQSNLLRYATAKNFAVLRQKVIENTDEKEWKAINKELKVFLKN